ncbi:LysR family transcriptional regulator [Bordetella holmesii]|uniref:LysR substrate-binding domain protein n=2 Tax=Bordetella holmesii TaxID=35814 RepID=A0A158M3P4_9BORD|nr:LysR family transcriptional regulator [Bordetella holmesii]EWM42835.1 bacterial regulatory helix-turn-helix, lysR family protein [Bordetella holmesii 41130]AMD48232.1 LysR family transcriptional regulator [Bordetella holmesii F627]KAK69665.1 LysR substrate-binding domain protein [Bordetella holmesii H620]KAK81419.1 LysR substrate-binding domain protein [Bordetella holmesii CDC-H809-BH]KAK85433.1 LysR substrate-binding domain protein [Bordetella holmesii CDC-H572-BH]
MDRLKAMQVFVEVADRGSLSAAATQLDMSRAMVSRYLAELEEWVGVRLLHRTTRRLSLTPAGAETLPRCRRMLDMVGDMRDAVATPEAMPRGMLRMSASPSFGNSQLVPVVADFVRRYPGTAVDLLLVDRLVDLVEERVDLAVRITNEVDPNLIARRLADCRSVVCGSDTYFEHRGVPSRVEDLAFHNCLTHSYHGHGLWRFLREGETVDVSVNGSITANEAQVLMGAALHGAGIALLPTYLAVPEIVSGRLRSILGDSEPQVLGVYGVYASRRQMPLVLRTMLDFLVERLGHEPWDTLLAGQKM